jgi:DNA-binding response OmpR family regulator
MDGITATEHLCAKPGSPPVIMMSVQGEQDYLRRAMLAGALEYLVKPFSADELIGAIRHIFALAKSRPRRQGNDPRPPASAVGAVVPAPDRFSDAAPCDLLPTEADMPAGFKFWEGAGPMDDDQAPAASTATASSQTARDPQPSAPSYGPR